MGTSLRRVDETGTALAYTATHPRTGGGVVEKSKKIRVGRWPPPLMIEGTDVPCGEAPFRPSSNVRYFKRLRTAQAAPCRHEPYSTPDGPDV